MSNTAIRPVIAAALGFVTYIDSLGISRPALVCKDYGSSVDLIYIDPNDNVKDNVQKWQLDYGVHGRLTNMAGNVPDQGNVAGAVVQSGTLVAGAASACTLTNSSTSVTVTGSTTGIPAAGIVTGPGIVPGTTYTISSTTVTLSVASTAASAGTGVVLTFSKNTITVGSATGIPTSGYVYGSGILPGTTYTISSTTVTIVNPAGGVQGAGVAQLSFSAAPIGNFWTYPATYLI